MKAQPDKATETCEDYVKPFYSIEQVAYSWCGMSDDEYESIKAELERQSGSDISNLETLLSSGKGDLFFSEPLGYGAFPKLGDFPCFRKRIEQIAYAVEEEQLPHNRDGRKVDSAKDHVARHRRTVSPKDLKAWFLEHHPNEKPAFIFNQMERAELINIEKLYEENEKLKAELEDSENRLVTARKLYAKQRQEIEMLKSGVSSKNLSSKTENLMSNLIKVLAEAVVDEKLSGKKHADASKLELVLSRKGIELPCSKETLATYIGKAD